MPHYTYTIIKGERTVQLEIKLLLFDLGYKCYQIKEIAKFTIEV